MVRKSDLLTMAKTYNFGLEDHVTGDYSKLLVVGLLDSGVGIGELILFGYLGYVC